MTLYRKYRPQFFADFIGQDLLKNIIQNEISLGQIAHAYLFSGPRGAGKTTMARLIAKAVSCQNRQANNYEPCDRCDSCLSIKAGSNLDLIEIDAASNRGINEIRELKSHIRVAPAKAQYKIFIIDEVHMLTPEAFNALLKTLEEPPVHAIFILATTEKHKLPATIISRCQCFDFKKIAETVLLDQLQRIAKKEEVEVDQEVLQAIAKRAAGSSRDAIGILGQLLSLNLKKISWNEANLVLPRSDFLKVKEFVNFLAEGDLPSVFQLVNSLLEQGVDLERFTKDLIEYGRQELVKPNQVSVKHSLINFYHQVLTVLIEKLNLFKKDLEIPQLPLEMAAVEIFLRVAANDKLDKVDNQNIPAEVEQENQTPSPKKVSANVILEPNSRKIDASDYSVSAEKFSLSLDDIKAGWPKILEAIKQYNNSLPMALNMCAPCLLAGQVLTLAFKFPLHANVLKNQKNREILEQAISQIMARPVIVKAELLPAVDLNNVNNKAAPATRLSADATAADAPPADIILDVFEGEIVKEI